jgi:uncharacterized delta-60 repeat protein
VTGVATQSGGRIVITTSTCDGSGSCALATARLTSAGALDPSFGSGGFVVTPTGGKGWARAAAVDSDDRIVVLGKNETALGSELVLVRYTANGVLDATFGAQGVVRLADADGRDLVLQPDHSIVTTGARWVRAQWRYVSLLLRVRQDGSLDPTFGASGVVQHTSGDSSMGIALAVQGDGRLVVVSETHVAGLYGFHVDRLLTDGTPDLGFGDGGTVHTSIGGIHDFSYAVALQPDGKIVVGGNVAVGDPYNPAFTVVRYLGGTAPCGNGTLDAGEACDDGNFTSGDCCSPHCTFESVGTTCADDANGCTSDVCDGAGACTHPANAASCDDGLFCNGSDTCAAGTCAAHAGDPCAGGAECARSCDETADTCNAPAGTPCTDDGSACSADVCSGSGACTHPAAHAGTECRTATGECDVAETCTGASPQCPADGHVSDGSACTGDALPCTTDLCGGGACVHAPGNAGAICRSTSGECDVAETCSGSSPDCPADAHVADGIACTPDTLPCSTDACSSGACRHAPGNAGTICRAASGECDVAEACTGASPECPADATVLDGTVCTSDARICTADVCGEGICTHPPGNAGSTCRAAAGECDVAEQCDGTSATCPTDERAPAGTACTPDAAICTADVCDGATTACTHPAANAGSVCRAAARACDVAETCDGETATCPADTGVPDTDADGSCDAQDPCTNVAGAQTFVSPYASLVLARVNTDRTPGNDKLSLGASFDLPPGASFADLAPTSSGVRVVLDGADDSRPLDVTLPPAAWSPAARYGWKRSGSGAAWTWLDRRATPLAGIVKLSLTDRGRTSTPRRVKLVITGRNGLYPISSASAPVQAIVALGDPSAGLCGESAFTPTDCLFNGPRNQLTCKR